MKRNIFLVGICIASVVLLGEISFYTYKIINNHSEKVTYDQEKEKPNEIDTEKEENPNTGKPNVEETENKEEKGKEINLNDDIKDKTLNFNPNFCLSQPRINIYSNETYYPTIWSKFDYAIHKLIETENITSCPEDYASEDCYFDLDKIKPYYIKYFGSTNYNIDVNKLKNYEDDNQFFPRYKDNKYFLLTACGEMSGPTSFYEELDKVIEINNTIEVYVKVAFISDEYNNDLVKQLYYSDYDKNNLIYETSYFDRNDFDTMIDKVIPSIKNNLAIYKYVLPKEENNYYFDHVERVE